MSIVAGEAAGPGLGSVHTSESNLAAALAAEVELVKSYRSRRGTVMMLPPEEIAAALDDVTAAAAADDEAGTSRHAGEIDEDSESDSEVMSDSSSD
jgi:hypothetical protein